jgi:hypothetical protein
VCLSIAGDLGWIGGGGSWRKGCGSGQAASFWVQGSIWRWISERESGRGPWPKRLAPIDDGEADGGDWWIRRGGGLGRRRFLRLGRGFHVRRRRGGRGRRWGVVVEPVEVVDEAFEGVGGDHSMVPCLMRIAAYAVLIIPATTSAKAATCTLQSARELNECCMKLFLIGEGFGAGEDGSFRRRREGLVLIDEMQN